MCPTWYTSFGPKLSTHLLYSVLSPLCALRTPSPGATRVVKSWSFTTKATGLSKVRPAAILRRSNVLAIGIFYRVRHSACSSQSPLWGVGVYVTVFERVKFFDRLVRDLNVRRERGFVSSRRSPDSFLRTQNARNRSYTCVECDAVGCSHREGHIR